MFIYDTNDPEQILYTTIKSYIRREGGSHSHASFKSLLQEINQYQNLYGFSCVYDFIMQNADTLSHNSSQQLQALEYELDSLFFESVF
ncbi:hypothetical protein [Butyrivibrio sp. NC2007]|uniref:hypothetical protein n=1 Tax=Butyrivibrio sp. NC2007 TaxID=1280683 RepID=UPI0003B64EFF|nr:hypothetical protein [Butyrivibrio sp. NC2007]